MLDLDFSLSLDGFDLRVQTTLGPSTAILGRSGAGKTSLLESIAGLRPARGRIVLGDEVLQDDTRSLPPEARGLGLVPQSGALFPHRSVRENLVFGTRRRQGKARTGTGPDGRAVSLDEVVAGLSLGDLLDRYPRHLSGGERKRVALGRALLSSPRLLLLDEPTAGLDEVTGRRALSQIRSICAQTGVPLIVVTHRPDEALALASEILWLERGGVRAQGAARRVLRQLQSATVRERLSSATNRDEPRNEESLVEGSVAGHSEGGGVTHVVVASGERLSVPYSPDLEIGRWLLLAIGADEVLVARQPPDGLSARNAVEATIDELIPQQRTVLMRAGDWFARLTPEAVTDLDLQPGSTVWLVVKTHSWRIVANDTA